MKILFCSPYMPPEMVAQFRYASEAANNFAGNLLEQLKKENEVTVLSFYSFPKEGKWSQEIDRELVKKGIHFITRIGIFSQITGFFRYQWKLFSLMRGVDYVLLYNYCWMYYAVLFLARLLGIKTALIIADHSGAESYTSFIRRFLARWAERDYRYFHRLILLSHHLYDTFQHPAKFFFPGAVRIIDYVNFQYRMSPKCCILYSGLLNEVTGIDLYLNAIRMFDLPNVTFVFTGRGAYEDLIRQAAQKDERIQYYGFVSRERYYDLLDKADIVVNPRNMNLSENKNNFPSKVMEYLASGKIILSTRFAGWEKFTKYILFVDASEAALCEGLREAVAMRGQGERIFEENRAFASNYDWGVQTKRLLTFLKD